jgi:two-component system nitrogen regulation response regulator GlnG
MIWVVDDDHAIRFVLEKALAREGLPVRSFASTREVRAALADEGPPQVLVSDIRMPGGSGLDLLAELKAQHPGLPVIVMTAFSDLDSAVQAFQGGAFDYLAKPFDLQRAVELIRRAMEQSASEDAALQAQALTPEMLGQAPAMQELFRAIGRLSQSQVTVLITGESGAGKELVARALHKHSPRAGGPFVAINTAAIPKDLLESELFGHERGAFTGAQAQRRGRFEQAEGGTLFLDEIGDMPLELQTRLLRVLSDGQYYRVGGHSPIRSQVRVIAATHQNLEQRVRDGAFREDLFHRLNVIRLRIPPLRERREDVALLARNFLVQSAQELGMEPKRLSDAALERLQRFDFPGNVRQLQNLCHWLSVMAPTQVVEPKDLPPEVLEAALPEAQGAAALAATASATGGTLSGVSGAPGAGVQGSLAGTTSEARSGAAWDARSGNAAGAGLPQVGSPAGDWTQLVATEALQRFGSEPGRVWDLLSQRFESTLIQAALTQTRGRRIEAARLLGIGRNTITRKIQELGLGRLRLVQHLALARSHRHMPTHPALRIGPLVRPLVARIADGFALLAVQQRVGFDHIVHGAGCATHRVNQARLSVHADVRLHPEVPLLALLALMHLGVALAALVLGRARGGDQGWRPPRCRRAAASPCVSSSWLTVARILRRELLLPRVGGRNTQDGRSRQAADQHPAAQAREVAEQGHVVQGIFHGRVAEVEPLLHEVNAQHGLDVEWGPASAAFLASSGVISSTNSDHGTTRSISSARKLVAASACSIGPAPGSIASCSESSQPISSRGS